MDVYVFERVLDVEVNVGEYGVCVCTCVYISWGGN